MSRPLCNHYAALLSSTAAAAGGRDGACVSGAVVLRTLPHPPPTYFLTAYARSCRLSRARRLFDAMHDPSIFTRNALLSALVPMPDRDAISDNAPITGFSAGCAPAREAGAYRALRQEDGGVRPSCITMSDMVMVASALGDRALGRQVHCHVLRLGFGAYAFIGSPLVGMYAKMGLIVDAKRVFDEMEVKNVVMYNTMITGMLRCKMVVEARRLFEVMVDKNSSAWSTMVTGLMQNGLENPIFQPDSLVMRVNLRSF